MSLATPRDLFIHDLSDMLSAENIIRGMLGEVIKETKVPDHKKAFQDHLKETEATSRISSRSSRPSASSRSRSSAMARRD